MNPDPSIPPSPDRLGIDLGGTKTEVAVLAGDGRFLLRERRATPRHDYRATLATIRDLVRQAEGAIGSTLPVGIGIPGALSPATGLVKNANSTWLNGQALRQDLEALLGRPVRIENDANCLAVSEAIDGAGAGARCVFAAILGTGVGAGICLDGRPLTGRQAIAGEWGHNPLPPAYPPRPGEQPGPACWCGRHGCIETWLSGPALAADHDRQRATDAAAVLRAARDGDPVALASRDRYADRLARALGTVINLLDPDVIVLGGGLSNEAWLYETLPGRLPAYVFSDQVDTPIRPARHGDSSGVRGAAWLWPPG